MWNRGPYCSIVLSTVDKRPLLFYVHGLNEIHAHTHTHTYIHTYTRTHAGPHRFLMLLASEPKTKENRKLETEFPKYEKHLISSIFNDSPWTGHQSISR